MRFDSDSMSSYSIPYVTPSVAPCVPSFFRVLAPSSVASHNYQGPVQAPAQAFVTSPGPSATSHLDTGHHFDVLSQVMRSMEVQPPLVAPELTQAQAPVTPLPALTETKQFTKWILKV
jgi:hypothetical protein